MPTLSRRHQLEGQILYHIINRGNRRLAVFHEDEDYIRFKDIVKKYIRSGELTISHYSLMPNHYHLEIKLFKISSGISAGKIRRHAGRYYGR